MTTTTLKFDPKTFRKVLGHYPTGVCVITAEGADQDPVGMVVGSFTSVSLSPPLIAFFPDKNSTTWPSIEQAGAFCVNVLAHTQGDLCARFAAKGGNKFDALDYSASPLGQPVLADVVAWIDCRIHAVHEAGDHYIVLGEVHDLEADAAMKPLLFHCGGYGQFTEL